MQNLRVIGKTVTVSGKKYPKGHVIPKGAFGNSVQWERLVEDNRLKETDDPVGAPSKKDD